MEAAGGAIPPSPLHQDAKKHHTNRKSEGSAIFAIADVSGPRKNNRGASRVAVRREARKNQRALPCIVVEGGPVECAQIAFFTQDDRWIKRHKIGADNRCRPPGADAAEESDGES